MRWRLWTQAIAVLLVSEGSVGLFQIPEEAANRDVLPTEAAGFDAPQAASYDPLLARAADARGPPSEGAAFGEWPRHVRRSRVGESFLRNSSKHRRHHKRRKSKLEGVCDVILDGDANGRPVCGPQVLIGGAMKCGTNSLGSMLALHPRVKLNLCKEQECEQCDGPACLEMYQGSEWSGNQVLWESHYFTYMTTQHDPPRDYQGDDGRRMLARLLPRTDGYDNITIDKSPSYLDTGIFPDVAAHAKRLLPHAKVVFSLCDPALRLYAEYYHSLKWDNKTLFGYFEHAEVSLPTSFSEWVEALQDDSVFCREHAQYCEAAQRTFMSKGIYVDSLQRWLDAFGRDKVLVMNLVEGEEHVHEQAARLLSHAGLPFEEYPWDALKDMGNSFVNHDYNGRGYAFEEAPEAMNKLRKYYKPHNGRLADVLHEYWPKDW